MGRYSKPQNTRWVHIPTKSTPPWKILATGLTSVLLTQSAESTSSTDLVFWHAFELSPLKFSTENTVCNMWLKQHYLIISRLLPIFLLQLHIKDLYALSDDWNTKLYSVSTFLLHFKRIIHLWTHPDCYSYQRTPVVTHREPPFYREPLQRLPTVKL